MIKDYVTLDNFLDDPKTWQDFAKEIAYHTNKKSNDFSYNKNTIWKSIDGGWMGYRSDPLHIIDYNKFKNLSELILRKGFGLERTNCTIAIYLHYLPDEFVPDDLWKHKDSAMFAGVIYLNDNPPPNTGTILFTDDGEKHIENIFNRLVLYKGNVRHTVENSFGKTMEDSRLTITFFVYSLSYDDNRASP